MQNQTDIRWHSEPRKSQQWVSSSAGRKVGGAASSEAGRGVKVRSQRSRYAMLRSEQFGPVGMGATEE